MSRRKTYSYRSLREGTPSLRSGTERPRGPSHKPSSSQPRSPPKSTSTRPSSHPTIPTGGKTLPKELTPPKSAPSHSRSSKRRHESKDGDRDSSKETEQERSNIVPTSQPELAASGSRDYVHGPEIQGRLEKLREQFPGMFFDRMVFVPALEPVPKNWDKEVIGHIRHVAKQYEAMKKHALNLSEVVRTLEIEAHRSKAKLENNERARTKLEKDLEDAQAQLALAQRDAANYKTELENAKQRFHSELDSNSQEKMALKKEVEDLRMANIELATAKGHFLTEKAAWEAERASLKEKLALAEAEKVILNDQVADAERRAALAEKNVDSAIEMATASNNKLLEREKEIEGFEEMIFDFLGQVLKTRNISWIPDYHVTLANLWDAIVEGEKHRLGVEEIDEDELMKSILRDNEPEDLAEGRRLILAEMEKERTMAKGKSKIDEGSSSAAKSKTSEVEEYHPDDPLIPLGLTPVVVGASGSTQEGVSAEGTFLYSQQFAKAIANCRRLTGQPIELVMCVSRNAGGEPVDKGVGKEREVEEETVLPGAEIDVSERVEAATAEGSISVPSADVPKDAETIEALKDLDGRHVDDEEDITGSKKADDDDDEEPLASRKARQEKELASKKVGDEALDVVPLAEFDPKTGLIMKIQSKSISRQLHFANPDDFPASLSRRSKGKEGEEETSEESDAPLVDKRKRKKGDPSEADKERLERQKQEKKSKHK